MSWVTPNTRLAQNFAEAVPTCGSLLPTQINAEGVFRYASVPWFTTALQLLANSGVHGVAVDVWVSASSESSNNRRGHTSSCTYVWLGWAAAVRMPAAAIACGFRQRAIIGT